MTNDALIKKASSVINSKKIHDYTVGDVGCALVTEQGNVYIGVSIDARSGMGFCAEASAIAAMVTAGETKIKKIVSTWKDGEETYIISPCGRCREFISFFDKDNLNTEVILSNSKSVKLSDLLPHHQEDNKI
ncbi:cytidine deaminase [Candidatus Gottesmanbacteria bacterium]|nr:cytidine deaminase [Candidatus Gottesmanbacteria bacterium]